MNQEFNGLKIYEIAKQHTDAYIPEGSTIMKFIELNELKEYMATTKTTTKKKTTTKTTTKKKKAKK